jgi:hypothetical protein
MSMMWDYVSELWPPTGLLFIPQVIYEFGELRWNDMTGNPKNSEENYPSVTLSTKNLTWIDTGANPGLFWYLSLFLR